MPTKDPMAPRLRAHLPRIAVLVLAGLAMTATLTYAAGRNVNTPAPAATTTPATPPVVVPDVVHQAFVFAKGELEDGGFSWKVVGPVQGYPANTVVKQSPAAGTKVLNTGAPLITLTLARNPGYSQSGTPEDTSPYEASVLQPASGAAPLGPEHTATTTTPTTTVTSTTTTTPTTPATTTPATTTAPPATTASTPTATTSTTTTTGSYDVPPTAAATPSTTAKPSATAKQPTTRWPQSRPPAFVVPGARAEPLDEMPLADRAAKLGTWLDSHRSPTNANVKYWLYQNEWVVTGAKLGWWHGAQALRTLIAVDARTQALWGIGGKSKADAEAALAFVDSKTAK